MMNKKESKRTFSKQFISNKENHPKGYNNPQWLVDSIKNVTGKSRSG